MHLPNTSPFSPNFSGFRTFSFWTRSSFKTTENPIGFQAAPGRPKLSVTIRNQWHFQNFQMPKDGSVYAGEWVGAVRLIKIFPNWLGWVLDSWTDGWKTVWLKIIGPSLVMHIQKMSRRCWTWWKFDVWAGMVGVFWLDRMAPRTVGSLNTEWPLAQNI